MSEKEIPKAYIPADYEDGIYQKWEEAGYFNPDKCIADGIIDKDAPSFSIIMPPPNVTGVLHMGSAAMLAVEDIMVRFERMKGKKALWIPGTDHAAIATQNRVEKNLRKEGITRHMLGREEFLRKVEEFAENSKSTIRSQIRKMGSSCDWSREAYTMDETRTRVVRTIFKMMFDDGLIYRGERVVNWCPRCQSTLADDEVEYSAQKAKLYYLKYDENFPITIATTRPETKLGDTAVAVNPKDGRYKKYIGKTYEADFCGVPLSIKIIAERSVDMEFGTGAVGVTPAHSMADAQMAVDHDLESVKVISEDGIIREGFGDYSGKSVLEEREKIVDCLKGRSLIEKEEEVDNNLSVCYRCETPIEPLPSLQWFINVNKLIPKHGKTIKELSVEAVKSGVFKREKIRIFPERFEKNYFHWMENLRDWTISRQIWFGHRIPVWYCQDPKKPECRKPIVSIEELHECPYCGAKALQDEDTLDTWFSSGLWSFSTMLDSPDQITLDNGHLTVNTGDFAAYHPTAVLETMYDILFFWVARMIIMTTYAVGDIPFQDVYLHGCVRDIYGDKMSKSKPETNIDPLDVCEKFGTDAVRLSLVLGSAAGSDLRIHEEKISGLKNLVNKLWNIARYSISVMGVEAGDLSIDPNNLTYSDIWILKKMQDLVGSARNELNNYNFSVAAEMIRDFTWNDLADWYLEASKFEKSADKSKVLYLVLRDLLKLWHPFMPFVTEAIWKEMGEKGLLMVQRWPSYSYYDNLIRKSGSYHFFELIKNIVAAIRNARSENKIPPGKKIDAVIYAGNRTELVSSQEELLKGLRTGIDRLEVKGIGDKLDNAIYIAIGDIEIYLTGTLDKEKEISRINKEIARIENSIGSLKAKLNNRDFMMKAPPEIIEAERQKFEKYNLELDKMKNQLENLNILN